MLKFTACTLLLGIVNFISCTKVPVTTAPANQAPIAKAGPYQTIGLPANTVILDGICVTRLIGFIFKSYKSFV